MELQSRRAHLLMVSGSGAGHYFPFRQILYLLSAPRYVSKIIVTVVDVGSRLAQLAELKGRGDFGSLDLRFEEMMRPAMSLSVRRITSRDRHGPENSTRMTEIALEPLKEKLLLQKEYSDAPTCILSDMFFTFLVELAEELRIPWYPLVPAAARYTYGCYLSSDPRLRSKGPEARKQNIPGLEFARVFDYPSDILDFPEFFAAKCERFHRSEAILVNDVEAWDAAVGALPALRKHLQSQTTTRKKKIPKVLLIGPLADVAGFRLAPSPTFEDSHEPECVSWLDKQPPSSVLYIAFGSMLNLTDEAMSELAHGLENSGVSFLWVHKDSDTETAASALPAGFEDRCRGRGFIEKGFAPQSRILQHTSVGGFMSHCGWNSCMESICAGVPLITWPLSLEQPLNARFIVCVWKAGVGIKKPDEDYRSRVSREEVTGAVQALMNGEEGQEVRRNVQKLKSLAETAVKEGGSSYAALHSFAEEITDSATFCTSN